MGKYAVIDPDGFAVNCVDWDGLADWSPPDGHTIVELTEDHEYQHGWKLIEGRLTDMSPKHTPEPVVELEDPHVI